jgi:hypothetical protein
VREKKTYYRILNAGYFNLSRYGLLFRRDFLITKDRERARSATTALYNDKEASPNISRPVFRSDTVNCTTIERTVMFLVTGVKLYRTYILVTILLSPGYTKKIRNSSSALRKPRNISPFI